MTVCIVVYYTYEGSEILSVHDTYEGAKKWIKDHKEYRTLGPEIEEHEVCES